MLYIKSLLAIVVYTSVSAAIPLTPQRGTQWQGNEKTQSPSSPVVVPVQQAAQIKITVPIARIQLSRISGSRAHSIIIVPSDSQPQNAITPTISSPETHQQQPNTLSKPTSLSEQIEAYKSNPIMIPPRIPSSPNSNPNEPISVEKTTMDAKRRTFALKTKMLVRIGKGRVIWAIMHKGKWVGVEGVASSNLIEAPKREGVQRLEGSRGRGEEQVGEL